MSSDLIASVGIDRYVRLFRLAGRTEEPPNPTQTLTAELGRLQAALDWAFAILARGDPLHSMREINALAALRAGGASVVEQLSIDDLPPEMLWRQGIGRAVG